MIFFLPNHPEAGMNIPYHPNEQHEYTARSQVMSLAVFVFKHYIKILYHQ
jgi:hypothetical protein